ncbi:hypothetical protein SAMN04487771_100310 [[Clostridium] aminophilum]|uniref:Uncharacterized protein n=1 Tax=[Clostridium] aminophilum TaxID=1526 RepID=A0A1I0AX91_9FIRM|nr:hypothetical protein [[Clostridium] aminophilum]SES99010.1 hypothetical protein SAMN04487771_100310 [[Clostridium] aminophilum]
MDKKILIKKMKEFIPVKEKELNEKSVYIENMSFAALRDSLIGLGTILDEDFDANSYVVNVPAGIANKNSAVVAVQLKESELFLLGFAKEGLISQHTAEKAIEKVIKKVSKYVKK